MSRASQLAASHCGKLARLRMAKVPVHEFRRLTLPLETAVDAVLELDREHGGALARGTISEARIETGPEGGLVLGVRYSNSIDLERRRYALPAVAAAIIHYCWRTRIPLPRHGTKSIEVSPEGFTITIQGTVEILRRHGPIPSAATASPKVEEAQSAPGTANSAPDDLSPAINAPEPQSA